MRGSLRKKTGSPYWHMRYRVNGALVERSTKQTSRREAERVLREALMGVDTTIGPRGQMALDELARRWLATVRHRVRPNTFQQYDISVGHILEFFGPLRVDKITPMACDEFVLEMAKTRAAKTVNNNLRVLSQMLDQAVTWEVLARNPAAKTRSLTVERQRIDPLTAEEAALFLESVDPWYQPLFATALYTGARQSELLALKWSDVSWRAGNIVVTKSTHASDTKTKSSRRAIAVPVVLMDMLKRYRKGLDPAPVPSDLLFVQPGDERKPVTADVMRRQMRLGLAAAGLRPLRVHDLRHTYATLLISLGANVKFIQQQLGHDLVETTLGTYGHLLEGDRRMLVERMATELDAASHVIAHVWGDNMDDMHVVELKSARSRKKLQVT